MALTLSNLKPARGSQKKRKRVGRGNASGHGTYSTRGVKGQKARSGGRAGLKKLGLKMTLRRIPKKKGFKSLYPSFTPINLQDLEKHFVSGETVTMVKFLQKGLISRLEKNVVKILGTGQLTKKLIVQAHAFSASASQAIIKAGGDAVLITKHHLLERSPRRSQLVKKKS